MKTILLGLVVFSIFFMTSLNAQVSASEEYIVEKNDTLWDISTRKLEDPFLWPKLWNVNPHIENPDLIYPGTKVFIPSREELMQIPALPAKEMPAARIQEIGRPKKKAKSEFKSIWKYAPIMQKKHIIEKNLFIASGWISDTYPGIGEITASPLSQQMSSKNDIVYVKLSGALSSDEKPALILSKNESPMNKKRFFAIRDIKIVRHPVTGEKIGHQIRITGILEVIGMDGDMLKAEITDSFEDVSIGDGLLPYQELEPPLVPDTVRTPDIQGYIIESHMNSYLVGKGNIIFLDKGENDGIKVGDVFTVLRVQPAESPIGKMQVISLQPSTAGAVILENSQEVKIGAKWGGQ